MTVRLARLVKAFAMPWNAFVAAFLYYTLLAMIVLGGVSPGIPVVATAYLAPLVIYLAVLANRALQAFGPVAAPQAAVLAARYAVNSAR